MPEQRGQTYNPQEEPPPRSGSFQLGERPFHERLDWAFRLLAAGIAGGAVISAAWILSSYATRPPTDEAAWAVAVALVVMAAGLAYGSAYAIGMILVWIYGALCEGSDFVMDWCALRPDLPLRRHRIVLLEAGLLLASQAGALWGLALFIREGLVYRLAMFTLISAMIYWPFPWRRMQTIPERTSHM